MARLSKKEQELKSIESFQKWFDRIDKAIKMLAVIVFGISFVAYIATLTAGFFHLIGVINKYEHSGWIGWISIISISIGLIGTEFSAVYGVVYEELQTSKTKPTEETKRFYEKLGIHSFVEFSMYFMAVITGFANFLYSLYVVKEKQNLTGVKFAFVSLEDIIGPNKIDDLFQIDPVTLIAITAFSTIIPIIMIVQSKMQIQFLRFIMKTIASIKRAQNQVETKVNEEKEIKYTQSIEKTLAKAGITSNSKIIALPSEKEAKEFAATKIEPQTNTVNENIEVAQKDDKQESKSENDYDDATEIVEKQIDNEIEVKHQEQIKPAIKKSRNRIKKTVISPNVSNKVRLKRTPFHDDIESMVDEIGMGPEYKLE